LLFSTLNRFHVLGYYGPLSDVIRSTDLPFLLSPREELLLGRAGVRCPGTEHPLRTRSQGKSPLFMVTPSRGSDLGPSPSKGFSFYVLITTYATFRASVHTLLRTLSSYQNPFRENSLPSPCHTDCLCLAFSHRRLLKIGWWYRRPPILFSLFVMRLPSFRPTEWGVCSDQAMIRSC